MNARRRQLLLVPLVVCLLGGFSQYGRLVVASTPPTASPQTTTKCGCGPEFDVIAEGKGVCEVTKDDTHWCRLKFNDGTPTAPQALAYFDFAKRRGIQAADPYVAAQEVSKTAPAKWSTLFVRDNFAALAVHTLYDADPEVARPVYSLLSDVYNAGKITDALNQPASGAARITFDQYNAIVSLGCLQLMRGSWSMMIKTLYSPAIQSCALR